MDFVFEEGEIKPEINFDKEKDLARVHKIGIIIGPTYSKDFDEILEYNKKVNKNIGLIKNWNNQNKSGMIKLELMGSDKNNAVLFGGPTLYLTAKMSELLETEHSKTYIRSAKGVDKFNL
jgi:hypothetical protein